jgi:Ni/Co efflux regulator RcnB
MNRLKLFVYLILVLLLKGQGAFSQNNQEFVTRENWEKHARAYNYNESSPQKAKKEKTDKKEKTAKKRDRHESSFSMSFFSGNSGIVYLFIAFVAIALVLLIVLIIVSLFRSPENTPNPEFKFHIGASYDNIEKANLDTDLQYALKSGEYKEAVRLRYLMLLRLLNKHKMVIWKKDKTNGNYLREMYGKKEFDLFRKLTLQFERIWYGEIAITEQEYTGIIPVFEKIHQSIESREIHQ